MSAQDAIAAICKRHKDEEIGPKNLVIVVNHTKWIGPCTKAHAEYIIKDLKKEDSTNIIRLIELDKPTAVFDTLKGAK